MITEDCLSICCWGNLDFDLNTLNVTFWAIAGVMAGKLSMNVDVVVQFLCMSVCTGMLRIISEEYIQNFEKKDGSRKV